MRFARNCRNCAFPQNFHTSNLGKFLLLCAVDVVNVEVYLGPYQTPILERFFQK